MKTSKLTGPALDWAVAWANGNITIKNFSGVFYLLDGDVWNPSTNWAQGGPIIERERICPCPSNTVAGSPWSATDLGGCITYFGPTPLIAAMRCYVASKLGDEVEVPNGLA